MLSKSSGCDRGMAVEGTPRRSIRSSDLFRDGVDVKRAPRNHLIGGIRYAGDVTIIESVCRRSVRIRTEPPGSAGGPILSVEDFGSATFGSHCKICERNPDGAAAIAEHRNQIACQAPIFFTTQAVRGPHPVHDP